jgi:hypothetical protein
MEGGADLPSPSTNLQHSGHYDYEENVNRLLNTMQNKEALENERKRNNKQLLEQQHQIQIE